MSSTTSFISWEPTSKGVTFPLILSPACGTPHDGRQQCRFLVLAIQEAFAKEELLQDVIVDFVVTVYPRIVSSRGFQYRVGSQTTATDPACMHWAWPQPYSQTTTYVNRLLPT